MSAGKSYLYPGSFPKTETSHTTFPVLLLLCLLSQHFVPPATPRIPSVRVIGCKSRAGPFRRRRQRLRALTGAIKGDRTRRSTHRLHRRDLHRSDRRRAAHHRMEHRTDRFVDPGLRHSGNRDRTKPRAATASTTTSQQGGRVGFRLGMNRFSTIPPRPSRTGRT